LTVHRADRAGLEEEVDGLGRVGGGWVGKREEGWKSEFDDERRT
jgi:hypothetical protein